MAWSEIWVAQKGKKDAPDVSAHSTFHFNFFFLFFFVKCIFLEMSCLWIFVRLFHSTSQPKEIDELSKNSFFFSQWRGVSQLFSCARRDYSVLLCLTSASCVRVCVCSVCVCLCWRFRAAFRETGQHRAPFPPFTSVFVLSWSRQQVTLLAVGKNGHRYTKASGSCVLHVCMMCFWCVCVCVWLLHCFVCFYFASLIFFVYDKMLTHFFSRKKQTNIREIQSNCIELVFNSN